MSDKAKHEAEDLGGKLKETAGSATGNRDLENDGKQDQAGAKLKKVGDDIKNAVKGD